LSSLQSEFFSKLQVVTHSYFREVIKLKRRLHSLFTFVVVGLVVLSGGLSETSFAQAKPPTKIRLATSTAGLDFAPIWIAQRKGYFKEEGIDFEHILTTGGAVTMAALTNGDVQFVSTAASDVLIARARGDRLISLGVFPASLEFHIATTNKWLESRGLSKNQVAKMTVAQKIQGLKGTTIGAVTVGGAPAQVVRYLLRQNNIKPDTEVRFAAVGSGSSRINALRQGLVDMIVGGIPDTEQPELEGWGLTYLRLGHEIEIFKDYPHESVHGMEHYIKANPEATRALLRAMARGNNLLLDSPAESDELLVKQFPKISPSVLKTVMSNSRSAFRRNMRATKSGWDNMQKVFVAVGLLKTELNTTEGEFWTNQYLP
jgi:NitT/TauT family transport system substrate-binding protein